MDTGEGVSRIAKVQVSRVLGSQSVGRPLVGMMETAMGGLFAFRMSTNHSLLGLPPGPRFRWSHTRRIEWPVDVRGLLQPLLGCASHDQRYPSGKVSNEQTVFLFSVGAPVKGLGIGCVYRLSGRLGSDEVTRQDTRDVGV